MSADTAAIKKQVEFYFSESNFRKDKFMQKCAEENNGFVPIAKLLTFNKLKSLTTDAAAIIAALVDSEQLIFNEDKSGLRNTEEYPQTDSSNLRTLYVKGYPIDDETVTIESIAAEFAAFGKVLMVRLRRDYDTKKFKGSVFVEFDSEAAVTAANSAANKDGAVQLKYKDAPLLCVMPFNAWFAAKQSNKLKRKTGHASGAAAVMNGDVQAKKRTKTEDAAPAEPAAKAPVEYTNGLIIRVGGLPSEISMFEVKDAFKSIGDVKYVEYAEGETTAYVRTVDAESTAKIMGALAKGLSVQAEGGDAASSTKLTGAVLEGEEEKAYWEKIQANAKSGTSKGGRGGGRGGRGGRGGGRGGRGGGGRGGKRS